MDFRIAFLDPFLEVFNLDIDLNMNLNHPELLGYGIREEVLRFNIKIKENFLPRIS